MCGCGLVSDLEVHHIRPRVDADGKSHFTDGSGRDDVRNLIVVCSRCHDHAHTGQLGIGMIKQTSDGPIREDATVATVATAASAATAITFSKWSDEEKETILNMLRINQVVPLKVLVFRLKMEHSINISEGTLRKVKKNGGF
jgi:hypothetical protein